MIDGYVQAYQVPDDEQERFKTEFRPVAERQVRRDLIANIAHRTRTFLEWDAKKERFTNSDAANKLLAHKYRDGYELV